ncbi:MAG: MATE family efflux transporter [Pseudomonadota bacterium]
MATKPALDGRTTPLRAEIRATLALALPLIVGNFAQAAINTTDVLILGRYDVDALAASALGVNIFIAFAIFAVGLVTAASPMIASERGRKPHSIRDVRRTVRQACWASAAVCIPIWAMLWNTEAIMRLLGQDAALSEAAASYVRVMMWGLLPFLIFCVLRYYVAALERPIWGVIVTIIGVGFNAVADWVLVFGLFGFPELGLIGAAIASLIANCVLMFGMMIAVSMVAPFRRYRLFGRFWQSDWPRFIGIMSLGLPIAVTLSLEVTVFNAAVFLMGLIDRESLAAHAIAIQVASLAFMIPFSVAQAATVRVGIWHGREDKTGVARAGTVALGLGCGAALLLSTTMVLLPEQLVGLFVDPADPESAPVFRHAVSFLIIAALFQLVDAAQAVGAGVLRGLHDTRVPMLFAAIGYWVVGLGLAIWLGFPMEMAGVGIWIGLAAGLAAAAVLMVSRWAMRERIGLVRYG